ncbi:cation transporter [Phototrophicus methaneseepsis]|uniref:Cation transporter n=1 Tax=Phototrophicus methaneseepsis TaxID=2710758 RepID=A0A7S8EA67_9CHLR|nr:cation diffusion facilitator family transporter [Phototrophicus methaneseepsis]QPC83227.1 cation transporter [Phototrophicus methaneseepsis]
MNNTAYTKKFAYLSITAAVVTIALKMFAFLATGSVGLLSDAMESLVNLAAAIFTLFFLILAARPADEEHAYGHSKAEYFSSSIEGMLIVFAAGSIAIAALNRLAEPQPIEQIEFGAVLSIISAVVNFIVARTLLNAAAKYDSIALEADAHHLMTDVWTSAGVLVGVIVVVATGWTILDPIIALIMAANIVRTGALLIYRSAQGLMDRGLPDDQRKSIVDILEGYVATQQIQYHALRTRQAGMRRFVSMHILVPGHWTVQAGHNLLERIEDDVRERIPEVTVFTHLEPQNDPKSWQDTDLDRSEAPEVLPEVPGLKGAQDNPSEAPPQASSPPNAGEVLL